MTMLGAIGAFGREMMLERQREGIAKAKSDGKYKGFAAKFVLAAGHPSDRRANSDAQRCGRWSGGASPGS